MKIRILLFTVFFCCIKFTKAQPGTLDPSFGNKGIVTSDLGARFNYPLQAVKTLPLSDGNFLTVHTHHSLIIKRHSNGTIDSSFGDNGFSKLSPFGATDAAMQSDGKIIVLAGNFGLGRFNIDGNLDSTFGKNGIADATDFGKDASSNSLAIQNDGKIVVAGSASSNGNFYFAVSRYNVDGSLDKSFSDDGQTITGFGFPAPSDDDYSELDYGKSVAIESDGKILVAGSAYNYFTYGEDFAIVRYNQDGILDSTFDIDGKQTTNFNSNDFANCIAVQKDGKIVVAGSSLARYNTNGSLDSTFSDDGKQLLDFSITSLTMESGVKILAAGGYWNGNNTDFVVSRYNANGSPDNTFNGDGKIIIDFDSSDDYATALAINKDEKIVLTGYNYPANSSDINSFIFRFSINGLVDSTLNGTGKLIESLLKGNTSYSGSAVQKDGKLVAAGYTWNGKDYDFVIARYNAKGSLDKTFNGTGSQITDFGQTEYEPHVAIQNDGKILIAGTTGYNNTSFAIARYNINGTIDSTFNGNGKQSNYLGYSTSASAIAIQNDGKIVVTGGFVLTRYNTDGSLDISLNNSGILTISFFISSLAIQSDGKLVIGGNNSNDVEIMRLNTNGTIDNTFGGDGIQTTDYGFDDETVCSMVIQTDGKIIAAAQRRGSENEFLLSRYDTNGNLDTTFSRDGKQTTVLGNTNAFATSLAVQNDGKIIVAGNTSSDGRNYFAFVRYNKDGSLDNTFGKNGIEMSDPSGPYDRLENISILSDKLYAIGSEERPAFLGEVARYLLTSKVPPTVNITTPANNAVFAAPATVTVTATAADADGTVSSVKFYNGTTYLKTVTASPYTCTLSNLAAGTYSLTAKATDNNGLQTTSQPVTITVLPTTANKAPVVKLTAPGNNAVYSAPATIDLTASATDADGTISKVLFYNGSTLLKTDSTSPYTCTANNVSAGNYSFTAKAFDDKGLSNSSASVVVAVSVATPNKAPSVSITNPVGNVVYNAPATINISAAATDTDGVVSVVKFYSNGTLLGVDSTSPYTYTIKNAATGNYSLIAKATDNKGLSSLSSGVYISVAGSANKAPTVRITSPANNSTYTAPATITINALAADADGTVSSVKFYNGTTYLKTVTASPYTYTITNLAAGTYSLTAKATDNLGAQTISAAVKVTVTASNKAPTVSITSPANNSTYTAPATITINALAADADGTISSVKFYNGTTYLKTVFASPYTYTITGLAAGTYSLTAKATDNLGAQTISASVTVKVFNASIVNSKPYSENEKIALNDALGLRLAPNPTNNIVNIYTNRLQANKPATLSIISVSGMVLKTMQISNAVTQLDVPSLTSGVYIVKIISGDKVMYKQFVKL